MIGDDEDGDDNKGVDYVGSRFWQQQLGAAVRWLSAAGTISVSSYSARSDPFIS